MLGIYSQEFQVCSPCDTSEVLFFLLFKSYLTVWIAAKVSMFILFVLGFIMSFITLKLCSTLGPVNMLIASLITFERVGYFAS